jgi:hypothetical protein
VYVSPFWGQKESSPSDEDAPKIYIEMQLLEWKIILKTLSCRGHHVEKDGISRENVIELTSC